MDNYEKTINIIILALILLIPALSHSAVRVIYFVPNDRPPQPAIPIALDTRIKAVQQFYADQMEAHGYDKTFQIETDTIGKVVVHHIIGNHNDIYYHDDTLRKVHAEVKARFDTEKDVYVVIVDVSSERIQGNCGMAYFDGGPAMFPATGACVTGDGGIMLIAHELGHAFNLEHDFRDDTYTMSYGVNRDKISRCAAHLLSVSPYFNAQTTKINTQASIEMLSETTYKTTDDWTLYFSVSDPDGIHQVQLLHALPNDVASLWACQRFQNANAGNLFVAMPDGASLSHANNVWLRVIDANGYITTKEWELNSEGNTQPTTTPNTSGVTYLTLTHNAADSLTPVNDKSEWDGWIGIFWERYPNGQLQLRPNGFVKPDTHIPYFNDWDHFFYLHAESKLVYDLSDGNHYSAFDAYFFLPNPCGNIASVEIICYADSEEIYNSGKLRKHQTQNINISFHIPDNTETLTIQVTDAADGNACDHYIFGNPRLLHKTEPMTSTERYADVNRDGNVNLVDLVIVASRYGERITGDPTPNPDVNRDGIVDINDIILITNEMPVGDAPHVIPEYVPIQTQLFPNYPNPFNPETWIPYQLVVPAEVDISIHAADGALVRRLDLGHQPVGIYKSRSRAAYWDGRNELGELVASGVYFYTLIAGEFTATRKMLIRK